MKNIDFNETIQTIANIGVVVGILFLALEIRQNTEVVRSATIQNISRWSYDAVALNVENEDLRAARRAACTGELEQDQRDQLGFYIAGILRLQANRFYQSELGVVDQDDLMALGGRGALYRYPIFAEIWAEQRETFSAEFQRFIDENVLVLVEESC